MTGTHMPQKKKTLALSVVATIYRTGQYLEEFARRAVAAAEEAGFEADGVEIVLVNDGCPAGGLEAALAVRENHPQVRVIDLSRNFGHHKAMMTGLRESRGDLVFLLDSDLEEEPEWLLPFAAHMREHGCDAVYGVQESRKGGHFEQLSGGTFYRLFNMLAASRITPNSVTARLMTRNFVDGLTSHLESEPFLFALAAITGFTQCPMSVKKGDGSPSSYSLPRKVRLALNSILSFSSRPLIYIAILGFLMTVGAFLIVLWLMFRLVFFGTAPEGWTSLIVSVWLVGGATILCIGIVSLYLAKIYDEVKHRPYSIIKRRYE